MQEQNTRVFVIFHQNVTLNNELGPPLKLLFFPTDIIKSFFQPLPSKDLSHRDFSQSIHFPMDKSSHVLLFFSLLNILFNTVKICEKFKALGDKLLKTKKTDLDKDHYI